MVCELGDHGAHGCEAQLVRNGEFSASRRFATRAQALAHADAIRMLLEGGGWRLGVIGTTTLRWTTEGSERGHGEYVRGNSERRHFLTGDVGDGRSCSHRTFYSGGLHMDSSVAGASNRHELNFRNPHALRPRPDGQPQWTDGWTATTREVVGFQHIPQVETGLIVAVPLAVRFTRLLQSSGLWRRPMCAAHFESDSTHSPRSWTESDRVIRGRFTERALPPDDFVNCFRF